MTTNEMIMYDQMVEMGIATPDEIGVARYFGSGSWEEVLNHLLFYKTGYRSFEQMFEEEDWDC